MNWPWVSRGRYEEAMKFVEEFRKSNAELYERLLAATAENARSRTGANGEPVDDLQPIRGKIRLDQIRTMANDAKRKENAARGFVAKE